MNHRSHGQLIRLDRNRQSQPSKEKKLLKQVAHYLFAKNIQRSTVIVFYMAVTSFLDTVFRRRKKKTTEFINSKYSVSASQFSLTQKLRN